MLTRIGDNLPRCQIYQSLFPSHGRLLQAISVVYLNVIHFCLEAKMIFRKLKKSSTCELFTSQPRIPGLTWYSDSPLYIEVAMERFQWRVWRQDSSQISLWLKKHGEGGHGVIYDWVFKWSSRSPGWEKWQAFNDHKTCASYWSLSQLKRETSSCQSCHLFPMSINIWKSAKDIIPEQACGWLKPMNSKSGWEEPAQPVFGVMEFISNSTFALLRNTVVQDLCWGFSSRIRKNNSSVNISYPF